MSINKNLTQIIMTLSILCAPLVFAMQGAPVGSLDEAVDGEFIIKFKEGAGGIQSINLLSNSGVKLEREVSKASRLQMAKVDLSQAIQSFGISSLASKAAVQKETIKFLNALPNVEYAEPNYIFRLMEHHPSSIQMPVEGPASNDPLLGSLWGMNFINAPDAWEVSTGTGESIVAVVDTGVDYTHPDLAANMWTAEDGTHGYNAINDALDPMDDHYHGTHVAGTIGAVGNNEVGVVGVSWNTKIMGVKFLSASGSGSLEGAIKAIDFATENGAHIMNNSWGGGGYTESLKEAIQRAEAKDILFICAAGNSTNNNDTSPAYPASYEVDNVVSVAALGEGATFAYFSNYGKKSVDIGAPGVDVNSASTGSAYRTLSGTSMASPHVAGAAALMRDFDSSMSYADIKERLIASSVKLAAHKGKIANGGASLNIDNMLRGVFPPGPIPVPDWAWSDLISRQIETAHPYLNRKQESWVIQEEGATHYRLHFEKFELESRYDTLTIKNGDTGEVIDVLSGKIADDYWTDEIEAGSLLLEFKSDNSVTKWGFKMDVFQWAEFSPEDDQNI